MGKEEDAMFMRHGEKEKRSDLTSIIRREQEEGRDTPPPVKSYANERQHGGDHYKTPYEHWDLVHTLGLNYFQGSATKYMSRWRRKGGTEDLLKAAHYCDKAAELDLKQREEWSPFHQRELFLFCAANEITNDDYRIIFDICTSSYDMAAATIRGIYSLMESEKIPNPRAAPR